MTLSMTQTLLPLAAPQTTTYLAGFVLTQRLLLPTRPPTRPTCAVTSQTAPPTC